MNFTEIGDWQYWKTEQANVRTNNETYSENTHFFICNIFISNARLKLAKNQVKAKQHPEAELLLFENYSHSSSTLSSNNNRIYSKKVNK